MKFKLFKAAFIGLILSFSCVINFANAGLITKDLINIGDGIITYDTATDLEWLDFDQNSSSLASALASWGSYGFRLANDQELFDLFNGFGISVHDNAIHNFASPAAYATAVSYVSMLGGYNSGTALDGFFQNDNNLFGFNNFQLRLNGVGYNTHSTQCSNCAPDADNYWKAVLVRNASPVPEPSTLAIFALGMMGLASRRFKKQS